MRRDNRSDRRRDSNRTMYKATCDECGNECEVPFKPSGDKPIYCSNCFEDKRDRNGGSRRPRRGSFSRSRFEEKQMFKATCDNCGKKCEVPFRPTEGKPIYCNDCFSKKGGQKGKGGGNDQVFQQLGSLSSKLDKIINLLESGAGINKSPKKETISKSEPKKAATAKKPVTKAPKKPAKKTAKK